MLYPQNGDRIVAIDSVTSLHAMYMYHTVCGGAADGWRRLLSHRRNRELKMVYFNFVTITLFKYLSEQHLGKVTMQVSSFCPDIFKTYTCCKRYEIHISLCRRLTSCRTPQVGRPT